MSKIQAIVTRESIKALIDRNNSQLTMHVIGRALLVLLANQTADERSSAQTLHHNGQGFGGCDAEIGTSHANYYRRNGYLTVNQVKCWAKLSKNGFPKIARYARQLNDAAIAKAQTTVAVAA